LVGFSALWSAFGPDIEISNTFPGHQLMQVARTGISFIQMENQSVGKKIPKSEFTLVFPQWEFYTIMFSVFLCNLVLILVTYVYLEGKANYFKGALLLFSYFVLLSAFFFEPLHQ
jgi:Ca2+/H+ antiporter